MTNGIRRVTELYQCRGLTVTNIHADNEFTYCRDKLRPVKLDIAGAGMHIGEVERLICTIKQRVR